MDVGMAQFLRNCTIPYVCTFLFARVNLGNLHLSNITPVLRRR